MVNSSKSELIDGLSHSLKEDRLVQYEYLGFPLEARLSYVFSATERHEFLQIPLCQKRAHFLPRRRKMVFSLASGRWELRDAGRDIYPCCVEDRPGQVKRNVGAGSGPGQRQHEP